MKIKIILALLFVFTSFVFASAQQQTMKREKPVSVGDVAPDFTLEDVDGKKITLSDSQGKELVVLVFYRGYW
jgi:cytochrome oxidase Cu insertion factor (SCO1/SenC/PrrC family)